jgi:hypothetical protein
MFAEANPIFLSILARQGSSVIFFNVKIQYLLSKAASPVDSQ